MALQWKLFSFATGVILRPEPLPVTRGGSVSIDVLGGDTMEVGVNLKALTPVERTSWRNTFSPMERGLALVDDAYEWDEPEAIVFAGPINKVRVPIGTNTAHVQIVGGLNDYMQARIVADVWGGVLTDGTTSRVFSGATWSAVMSNIVAACFSANGVPADAPKPPQVLGDRPSGDGDTHSKSVRITDAKTYHEVLEEVKNTDSGTGLEWRWEARYADATAGRIVWDFKTGNASAPHIGSATSYSLILSPTSAAKLSAFSTIITAGDMYTKLYIQSKPGDDETKDGADFKGLAVTRTAFPVLLERFYNPGVELTTAQLDEQLSKRIAHAARTSSEIAFTVEEVGDPNTWLRRLGGMLYVTSSEDAEEGQGHEAHVRIVGVSFTPGKGTVSLDVMEPQHNYGKLPMPRKGIADIARDPRAGGFGYGGNSPSLNGASMWGGGTPVDPGDPGDPTDGEWSWGSGGAPADGSEPPVIGGIELNLATNIPLTPLEWFKGAQNEGNILFYGTSPSGSVTREEGQAWPVLSVSNEIRTGVLDSGAIGYWQPSANMATVNEITIPTIENRARTSMGQAAEGKWLRSVAIDFAPVISVAGWVLAPFHATLQFSPNSGESGTTETWSRVLFLRAQYISHSQIGAFSLDPITEVREPWWSLNWRAERKSVVRAGSWLLFGQSNNAVAANFTSGGVLDNFTGWSSWPTGLAPKGEFAVAVRPNGGGYALYTSGESAQGPAQWFPLLGTTLMVEGEQPGEDLTEATPGSHYAVPFTMYGRVYYRVTGAGLGANGLYEPGASGTLELVQELNWPSRSGFSSDSWTHWNHAYIGPGNPGRNGGVDNRYHTLHFVPQVIG